MRLSHPQRWCTLLAGLFGLATLAVYAQTGPGGQGEPGVDIGRTGGAAGNSGIQGGNPYGRGNGGRGGRGGFGGGGRRGGRGGPPPGSTYDVGTPQWKNDPGFTNDVFTFARLIYPSWQGYYGGGNWWTDTPDADLNLGFRLHQLTSMKVNPGLHFINITPNELAKYPFVYIVEPGRLMFSDTQVAAMRKYLLNGGFLMVDDFWGDGQRRNFFEQIKRVLPEYSPTELTIEHPIFHTVFDLKEKPQMPAIPRNSQAVVQQTWENWDYYYETHDSHFFGIFDNKGRMMVFVSHNNDFGDGWERETANPDYFHRFSEKQAYPMMINILFYTMTH